MKLLFLTRALDYGGAERQLAMLARELNVHGWQPTVATFYIGGALEQSLRLAGVPIHHLHKRHRWDVMSFIWSLIKLIKTVQPDIVHGYLSTSNILLTLLKPFFPHIRVVWGIRASNLEWKHYDWLTRWSYKLECFLSRFADLIISNSHAGLEDVVACGFPRTKIVVIPNGIDTEYFKPDATMRARCRARWGIADHEKLIGLVARLDPMKGHETFLQAAAQLTHLLPNVRFVCIGDGPAAYRQQLMRLSQSLGLTHKLLWVGTFQNMPEAYNTLDLACSSSSFGEGFANVIGEAMACGVPCVVTDVGDSARIVGELGYVIPPRDPQQLAQACYLQLNASHEPTSLRARIVVNFSCETLARETEFALRRLF